MEVIVIPPNEPEPDTAAAARARSGGGEKSDDSPSAAFANALRNILTIASFPEFVGDPAGALESIRGITYRALEGGSGLPAEESSA